MTTLSHLVTEARDLLEGPELTLDRLKRVLSPATGKTLTKAHNKGPGSANIDSVKFYVNGDTLVVWVNPTRDGDVTDLLEPVAKDVVATLKKGGIAAKYLDNDGNEEAEVELTGASFPDKNTWLR